MRVHVGVRGCSFCGVSDDAAAEQASSSCLWSWAAYWPFSPFPQACLFHQLQLEESAFEHAAAAQCLPSAWIMD